MSRLERQNPSNEIPVDLSGRFDLAIFRKLANQALGNSWLALDYYMIEKALITIVITPENCEVYSSPLSSRIAMALDLSMRNQHFTELSQQDLRILGDFLLPASVAKLLTGNTFLLVAPHKRLHGIPWAAIHPRFSSQPLVYNCVLSVVPSLQSLCALWEHNEATPASHPHTGLVVGISEFQGYKKDLPHVKIELDALRSKLGTKGKFLFESDATWENLRRLKMYGGDYGHVDDPRFTWLHMATHFFADPHTGRLSGFTLWDGDVWLDQLRDLAPLPRLMTFSACNSVFSFIYEGDEHVDLPTTCFIGGSNSVIGSLWPILDESAARFTVSFYEYYLDGLSPAQAVNAAQKRMIAKGEKVSSWASIVCMGLP
jgi:CHAT domain-containing protein